MKNMTLRNIIKACGGTYYGEDIHIDKRITGVEKDSRLVEEGYLYVPFVGKVVDGHDFIPQIFDKGALCSLSERILENPGGPYILVEDTGIALKDIARFYREQLDTKTIGITGSVGKTSTKEIIASVLAQKYSVLKTAGNYNNEIGMPLTLLRIRDEHQVAVIEMGISDFGEMHRLSSVAQPDICVITNVGTCHLENLGDRDGVLKAKTEIFDYMKDDGQIFLNGDDDKLNTVTVVKDITPEFFGIDSQREVKATSITSLGLEGTSLVINYKGEEFDTVIPVPGYHMVYNALAATCVGKALGLDYDEIDQGIRSLKAVGGRNNIIKTDKYIVIDDCYNANPMSMKASIDVLKQAIGRKVAILGDMFELGENEIELHAEVGNYVANSNIDVLICVGTLSKSMAEAAKVNSELTIKYFAIKDELEKTIFDILDKGDNVLVKASNGMKFTSIVNLLTD